MNQRVLLIFIALILILPISAYIYQFGFGLWQTPSEWSALGGYVGGIYTPILTLLTLTVLSVQIYLQVIQHRQHLVSLQEKELSDYLNELNSELDKKMGEDLTLRQFLIHTLNDKNIDALKSMDLDIIFNLNQSHHKLYSMWCGAMACLKYIENHSKIKNYESGHYAIQKNKIIAYMSPQVCSSLDKFNYGMHFSLENITGNKSRALDYEFWLDKSQS
ncbi:hypothetical protein [Psychromonas sp. SR45-3]|uniref:hypothetical protein n=1 Tax=Psychromonas sp. SR45-3 TaxID=2760930 RepID=UPI0015F81FD6|nr:hypothetical protein [Psychromonas sp. SR45-3]MBB1273069.1 hypothetical protein [Psychromonas sp. SR45-3]